MKRKTIFGIPTLTLLIATIIGILTLSLINLGTILNPAAATEEDDKIEVTLKWVTKIDTTTGAEINSIRIATPSSYSSKEARMIVLTNRPEIFIVTTKDGTIKSSSGKFRPPTIPGQSTEYIDADPDKKAMAYLDITGTPKLILYDGDKDRTKTVNLAYISDPEPTVIRLSKDAQFVVVGDMKGYLALYEIKGL